MVGEAVKQPTNDMLLHGGKWCTRTDWTCPSTIKQPRNYLDSFLLNASKFANVECSLIRSKASVS